MGESGYWHVARRRWQVIVAFAELGVGTALVAAETFDSPRPLRDIVVGLLVGVAIGFVAVCPAEQLIGRPSPATSRGRHWQQPGGRHHSGRRRMAPHREVVVPAAPWPQPELSERPRPTFESPRRRSAGAAVPTRSGHPGTTGR